MTPIEAYIANTPQAYQSQLIALQQTIATVLPEAQEQLKYQMPTFYWHENVIHFALFKHHFGLYPTPSAIETFHDQLITYKTSKGALKTLLIVTSCVLLRQNGPRLGVSS